MSKRHTASRRRSYARRQHELHERIDRLRERRAEREAWRLSRDLESLAYPAHAGDGPFGFAD